MGRDRRSLEKFYLLGHTYGQIVALPPEALLLQLVKQQFNQQQHRQNKKILAESEYKKSSIQLRSVNAIIG